MNIKTIILLAVTLIIIYGASRHWYDKYLDAQARADAAEHSLRLANAAISDLQTRQRAAAELDARYTEELANARSQIEVLRSDVAAGKRRLQLNATCINLHQSSTASGVDDATSTRLTDSAQRDYFTLRERIERVTKQLTGLQEYITTQCLK